VQALHRVPQEFGDIVVLLLHAIHYLRLNNRKEGYTMERVMNKKDVLIETQKILMSVQLPMVLSDAINSIQASIKNIGIAILLIKQEEKPEQKESEKDGNIDAE
jgi:hypothetical protein